MTLPAGSNDRAHRSKLSRTAVVTVSAASFALAIWWAGALSTFEYKTWDWRAQLLSPSVDPSDKVFLVYIDEYSIQYLRETSGISWPWPREAYALMTRFFARAGAAALAFDVIFSDPSAAGVHDDLAFSAAMRESGTVVSAGFIGDETGSLVKWPDDGPPLVLGGPTECGAGTTRYAPSMTQALLPVTELLLASRVMGNVNVAPDSDGVYRRSHLVSSFDGRLVPSLGLAAYLAQSPRPVCLDERRNELIVGGREIPVDPEGRALLSYPDRARVPIFNAAEIIQSELRIMEGNVPPVDPARFADGYVLVGASARGLYDLRPTPIMPSAPGVTVHATVLDNLLMDRFMKVASSGTTAFVMLLLVLPAALLGTFVTSPYRSAVLYLALPPVPVLVSIVAYQLGYWLPLLPLMMGVLLALMAANALNYAIEGRQKRYIKNAFQQYLSPAVIEQLIDHPERLRLGGERRDISIFFSDLEAFTSISEGLSPEALTSLLNDYLSAMTEIIQDEGGTIDKYEGDAIIAFWNAPLHQPDHAPRAVRAALRCQRELARLRPILRERAGRELFMRIGMNSGPAVVGNMGSRTRFDYTMLGDSVNLSARLEGINKVFGTYTLISCSMAERLGDAFRLREVSRVAVKGRQRHVTIHEPMDIAVWDARRESLAAFSRALGLYYDADFAEARAVFEGLADEDPVARAYVTRCNDLLEKPPADWDGVWEMTSK